MQHGYIAGGVLLDLVGVGLMAAGGAFLAIASGELAATAPAKHAQIEPLLGTVRGGAIAGVSTSF